MRCFYGHNEGDLEAIWKWYPAWQARQMSCSDLRLVLLTMFFDYFIISFLRKHGRNYPRNPPSSSVVDTALHSSVHLSNTSRQVLQLSRSKFLMPRKGTRCWAATCSEPPITSSQDHSFSPSKMSHHFEGQESIPTRRLEFSCIEISKERRLSHFLFAMF